MFYISTVYKVSKVHFILDISDNSILVTQFGLSENYCVFLFLSFESQPQEPVLGKTVRVLDVEGHE